MLSSERAQVRRGVRADSGKAARDSLPSHGPPARKERLSVLEEVTESGVETGSRCSPALVLCQLELHFCRHCCQRLHTGLQLRQQWPILNSKSSPLREQSASRINGQRIRTAKCHSRD